ncbi:phosphorylated adapter RNA export protein isoform X2 [Ascaphus truei]|uniref:phosphorylated adapter RNA export protein isoform X2 n=1 Tax=Ascaphus truei TaxID=8439 RepID=UPI003F599C14
MALQAARGMMEEEDLEVEDGEIDDSDTEMNMKVAAPPRDKGPQQQKPDLTSASRGYRSNFSSLPPSAPYRTVKGLDSSDDSLSDSDEEDSSLWRKKRQKSYHPIPERSRPILPSVPSKQKQTGTGPAKLNIWASVLQEQTHDAVASGLGIMDMEGQLDMSRQSESYNYVLAKKMMEKTNQEEQAKLDKELDEYMQDEELAPKEQNCHLKRKRPVKERLGDRLEMNYKGRYEITEDDPEDKVSDEIAHRLQEPKKDLMKRIVKTVGTKKAIELLMETAEVEQSGGLFIMNGSRRRTPGGVYLNLLKSTPSITTEQVKRFFLSLFLRKYFNWKTKRNTRVKRQQRREGGTWLGRR